MIRWIYHFPNALIIISLFTWQKGTSYGKQFKSISHFLYGSKKQEHFGGSQRTLHQPARYQQSHSKTRKQFRHEAFYAKFPWCYINKRRRNPIRTGKKCFYGYPEWRRSVTQNRNPWCFSFIHWGQHNFMQICSSPLFAGIHQTKSSYYNLNNLSSFHGNHTRHRKRRNRNRSGRYSFQSWAFTMLWAHKRDTGYFYCNRQLLKKPTYQRRQRKSIPIIQC